MTGQPMNDEPQFRQPENSERNIQDARHADDLVLQDESPSRWRRRRSTTNSVSAVLGTEQHDGVDRATDLTVNSTLGTVKLDMREAVFESLYNVVIDLSCFMGDVKIWVPKGTVIVDNPHLRVGHQAEEAQPTPARQPKLTLTGTLVFGEVIVYAATRKAASSTALRSRAENPVSRPMITMTASTTA